MKYKAIAFGLILSVICLSQCTFNLSLAAAAKSTATMSKDFFTAKNSHAAKTLSEAAASAVWQYGKMLGWLDEYGLSDKDITPRQLAMAQRTYNQALIYWFWQNPVDNLTEEEREACYARALFPGVRASELPQDDAFSGWSQGIQPLAAVDAAKAVFSTASADGKTGYVIVRFLYENKNGEFEDFYRVEWEADAGSPFPYRLKGVRPLMRFLLGGVPHEMFAEEYLGPVSADVLKKFGIMHPVGYLAKWGAWGEENTLVLKTLTLQGAGKLATYLLLDDTTQRIIYQGAFDETADRRTLPWQILTALQAKNLISANYNASGLFYPRELDVIKGGALCYGFAYNNGGNHGYAWVNSITGEVSFADEIEDYTRTGH